MKILLIAHDFPPIPSPQSLRWAYLARELAALGHEIVVLCPDHPGYGPQGGLPDLPDSVRLVRTYPGPFAATIMGLRQRRVVRKDSGLAFGDGNGGATVASTTSPSRLNWKGRLVERIRSAYAACLFPDVRAEWNFWAGRALGPLLARFGPDVVIASHEPASTLWLGLAARRAGYPFVADLGDPVCATYTPKRWRRRALALERKVCGAASGVVVTVAGARESLVARHGVPAATIAIIPQGHPSHGTGVQRRARVEGGPIELLYTGSFYDFRQATGLIAAVVATPGIRLSVATSSEPDYLREAARQHPDSVRILGFLTHADTLLAQAGADVLVNIANSNAEQVPGKLYEYLGADRPIIHVTDQAGTDPAVELLQRTGAGMVCAADAAALATSFGRIVAAGRDGLSAEFPRRDAAVIGEYRWLSLARAYEKVLQELVTKRERTHA